MTINIGPSYRQPDETYENYCPRRRKDNKLLKHYLKGKNVWNMALYSTFADKTKQEKKRARQIEKKIRKSKHGKT